MSEIAPVRSVAADAQQSAALGTAPSPVVGERWGGGRESSGLNRCFRRGAWEVAAMSVIGAGIIMLVQPLSIDLFSYSFVTILAGTLGFVAVSHFPD